MAGHCLNVATAHLKSWPHGNTVLWWSDERLALLSEGEQGTQNGSKTGLQKSVWQEIIVKYLL